MATSLVSLSQGTHIRFADSDDDDESEDKGTGIFSSNKIPDPKDNSNDFIDDISPVDYLPLVFGADNEEDYEGIEGGNEIITILEERKRKRKSIRIIDKMPTEACTSPLLKVRFVCQYFYYVECRLLLLRMPVSSFHMITLGFVVPSALGSSLG